VGSILVIGVVGGGWTDVPGGGAPLTIWSRLDIAQDMERYRNIMVGASVYRSTKYQILV
jgi:hypothetical protein